MKTHLPSNPLDESFFEDVFLQELDSWFAADIACCDQCYENFLKVWPGAYSADNAEFQTNQIQLDTFYEGSRINAFYTQEQFERLTQDLDCPRCGEKLGYILYPYDFPFDIPANFENDVEELGILAKDTPFLLLTNELAAQIFSVLGDLAHTTTSDEIQFALYKARTLVGLKNFDIEQFDFADPKFVGEGRYNHAGSPALYLGNSEETCFHELRQKICAVAKISFEGEMKILDLVTPYEGHNVDSDLLNALIFSALLSAQQDDHGYQKSAYIFSRFIADCARSVGFDAIKYPSTRTSETCFNLAVISQDFSIGGRMQLQELTIYDGKRSRTIEI